MAAYIYSSSYNYMALVTFYGAALFTDRISCVFKEIYCALCLQLREFNRNCICAVGIFTLMV